MATKLNWKSKQVSAEVANNVAKAFGDFGLDVEGESKRELRKGHGVITGTLRRSIHTAQPGYPWSSDDVPPSASSPDLGGVIVTAAVDENGKIVLQVGSGLNYALPVHQGHQGFEGYHFLTKGLEKAKPNLGKHLARYQAGKA